MRLRQGLRLAAAWVFAFAGAAVAAPVEVESLRVGFSNREQTNLFKIGAWTPVWVQVRAGADGFSGFLDLVAPDDVGAPSVFRQPITVAAGKSQRFVTYARPGTRDPDFTVRLVDKDGRRRVPDMSTASGGARAVLNPVPSEDLLLVTLGKPRGVDKVPALSGFEASRTAANSGSLGNAVMVAGFDNLGGALPGRWYGYDGASAVVLDTSDREVMKELATPRGLALEEWVKRGGHLVVSVGGDWQAAKDSVLGPMLPGVPVAQERVPSLEALDAYAGAVRQITPPGAPAVMVAKFEDVEKRGGKVLAATGDLPLVVRGPYGFGRVTAIAIDVDQKPFADWPDVAMFWVRALDLRRQATELSGNSMPGMGGGRFARRNDHDLASRLRQALEQFPGVRLVPFGWVAFFIFLYILLIGPGDYLFLKKVVKRMELTWVTFPLIVATVSLAAYYAAYVVKGKELRVNKLDVVDVDQTSNLTRGTCWLNVFSPQNRDYTISVVPSPLDRPAPEPGAAPGPTEVLLSWFGDPEPGFGGMGQSGRIGFSSGSYDYRPAGAAESLTGVRIPIWSTKALTARWFGVSGPLLESDLYPTGLDRLAGTVTNSLDVPLHDALLAYGRQVYQLGTIAPYATVRVELTQDRFLSGQLKSVASRYDQPGGNRDPSQVAATRAALALALMFHDSESAVASEESLTNNTLQYLDLTGQLQLGRPMLVARIDRPASTLVLDNSARTPKMEETTMLRVILPLKPAEGEAPNSSK